MTTLHIEYCHPCGYLKRAVAVQEAVLRQFGTELESATLTVGDHGVFAVRVDGQPVFDIADDEFDVDDIVRRVRKQL
ncbi:SelT/SelW/SelH family protein [Natronosalvus amylolyticus]|uniref:SelT/SelW/SelH family protein n=1 Tax=Natronosalvus amylolyticus TaxID=2961994 RepID=UPI0020C9CD81|nr:Rdx family protein [Natronosalvus amylolyticus]